MICKKVLGRPISRRDFLIIAGGGVVALTFFPKIAFSAQNEILAIRTGIQPGNKTRLVIETALRPNYTLSYPDGQLVVSLDAANKAKLNIVDGTLIKSVEIKDKKVIANLKKTIAPIPKSQTMILEPNGGSKYRLVLDFAAGSSSEKTKSAAATATAQKTSVRKPVVVIDPGHGGEDPGCIGATGTREKDVVLSVGKKLYDKLNAAGYNVYMTRRDDTFMKLGNRSIFAEKKKADLFVSIHANSNLKKTIKGFSVYTLSQTASDAEAQKLADAENAADKIEVSGFTQFEPEIRIALSALQQKQVANDSDTFAQKILQSTKTAKIDRVDRARRFAPFAVLKSTVPSCLVEIGHLSNKDEEKLLKDSAYQNKLVSALTTAVGNYDFTS
jgi:N-acetylmuramoyl-L-alanine amidase